MVDVYLYFPSTLSGMTSSLGRKVIGESVDGISCSFYISYQVYSIILICSFCLKSYFHGFNWSVT